MDNHDKLVEELNALIASTYGGGNSFAERSARARAQRRDRFGRFAEMFGLMKFKLRLGREFGSRAGEEVNVQGVYVGASDSPTGGWMYVSNDPNVPDGFYDIDGNNFREVLASLDPEYLQGRGIELGKDASGNPVGKRTTEDIPSTDTVNYRAEPIGFIEDQQTDGSFISEDGDITIEPNEFGGFDVTDNIDPANSVQSVDDLGEALQAVYNIDKTRQNFSATGEDATPASDTPVAELPDATPLRDPAGMTNAELTAEGRRLFGADGIPFPLADRERASQILDEQDTRAELEPDGYEGDWFADNADFVRDPSKSEAPATPVAEIPEQAPEAPVAELPVAEAPATAENTDSLDAIVSDIRANYPMIADQPGNRLRVGQRALADTRPNDEVQAEVQSLRDRLGALSPNSDATTQRDIQNYDDLLKMHGEMRQENQDQQDRANSPEGIARQEAEATKAQARIEDRARLQEEAASRLQSWIDNGGPAKVEELRARVREDGLRAFRTGELPDNFGDNGQDYGTEIQSAVDEIATVDGVVVPEALRYFVLEGLYGDQYGNSAIQRLKSSVGAYNAQQTIDAANPEKLDGLFSQYDADGSARALFDSGASYDEVYANLLAQNTGFAAGYDPYWRMAEFIRGVAEPRHSGEMAVLRRAVELRDSNPPVIEDAPNLDDELRTAIQNGNAVQVIEARRRSDAINSVVDSVNSDIPVVNTTPAVTEVPSEPVTEIPTISDYQFDYVTPTAEDLRRSGPLDGFGIEEIREALRQAVVGGKQEVVLGGETYPMSAVVVQLYNRYGFDSEAYIAGTLDITYGGSENLDALLARRRGTSDVTREEQGTTGQPSPQEVLDTWVVLTPNADVVRAYVDAVGSGDDTITITLMNYGIPDTQGTSSVDISVQELRQRLVDNNFDMDTIDGIVERNQQTREQVAEASGLSVEDATASAQPRTDWRDVLNQGSQDFRDVYFIDKNGDVQRYERREDGKWYEMNNPSAKGKTTAALIRMITRNADPEVLMEIDDGDPHDEDPTYDFNAHVFQFGSEQDEEIAIDEAIANDAWMHVSGGDLEAMRALERAGVTFNILDKMAELFPNGERRGDDEVVTETHEYTDPATGTKYRFEVVVTRTADEYFYTYVRRTNLTTGQSWSARVGHMSQSPYATFNNYRREIAKFHASFFNGKGPVNWFDADATRRRKKRDVVDPDTNQWVHAKDIQHNPQTMASIRALLGIDRPSTTEARRAEDAVMRSVLSAISKYRLNDKWMGIMAERISRKYGRNIDKAFMYQVADVYEAHMMNQNNLDRYGTWVSFDQRTPLDAGDTVEHDATGRRGVVRKRLGWVDSLGRYRYSDYVEVRWNNGDTSWTTSRMNRLIQTADGTDGSERIGYRDGYEDPRASYGTSVARPQDVVAPSPALIPAEPVRPSTQQATRNDNSELVLGDGTVVPEHLIGARPSAIIRTPDELVRGDFIGMLNDDRNMVQAPVLADAVPNAIGTGYTVPVAVRQSDGTYKVERVTYSAGPNEYVQVSTYFDEGAVDRATPAQVNEVLELLGSKLLNENGELPAGLRRDAVYTNILNGFGADMATALSREEFADIIQELRALPDRQSNRAEDAAMLADIASVEAERNNNADASQEFGALADSANVVASQPATEDTGTTPEVPSTPETPRGPIPESMNGTQILDPQWLSDAPIGTRVYSTSTGKGYEKVSGENWSQVLSGEVVSGGGTTTGLLAQRVSSGTLYVGSTPPATLPPGSQTSAAEDENRYPQIPRQLSEITPDVSAGWVDVPAETQINNPDWFAGAPVGTQVTLDGVLYEKREDGNWYPTTGSFTETAYSSEVMGTLGLLSRADQGQNASEVPSPREWELLPEGSVITDRDYIVSAPVGTAVALQLSDGSAPLRFAKLGNGKWELETTRRLFTDEQLAYRLENSGANTFTALPSEDISEVSTVVSSIGELRAFPEGTVLDTFSAGAGQRKKIKRVNGKWQRLNLDGSVAQEWSDARVMEFIQQGGVINNGREPNRFAVTAQVTSNGRNGASPARRGTRRPNSAPVEINYTPGSLQMNVTPEQFREIIRSGNKEALKALLVEHLQGKKFGKFSIGEIEVSPTAFSAKIVNDSGEVVGKTIREFSINSNGDVYVYNSWMKIEGLRNRGNGFSTNFTEAMYDFYRQVGVKKVSVTAALTEGAYTWARAGFGFVGAIPNYITRNLQSELSLAIREGRMQDAMVLNNMLQRILRGGTGTPTAKEIADINGQLQFYPEKGGTLGRELMAGEGRSWSGVRSIPTLEESLAFMEAARRAYERYQTQRNNGWNG